jgi:tartrate dehydrogenase/decarboxylase/D-malate dehydrogenase
MFAILAAVNVLGSAPTTNLNPEGKCSSQFMVRLSTLRVRGVANPIGTFWTGALLLEHLGEKEAASRLMLAIETVTADKANHCQNLGWQGDHPPRH